MTTIDNFLLHLVKAAAVLVTVQSHRGSVPREVGAWMAVFADMSVGTVGGGHLEWQAISHARTLLASRAERQDICYKLGPSLGQCCGGEVTLGFELVQARDVARLQQRFALLQDGWARLALFGAGHVAQALVQVMAPLPLKLHWIDSRDAIFPRDVPSNVQCEHSDPVQGAVATVAPGAQVLIMSFSHAQDLEVLAACLQRQRHQGDLAQIGLIGSQTKWATFRQRLTARGFGAAELAQVTCPIGLPGITGKEPAVIAVAVAAQVLQVAGAVQLHCPGASS